ncbi:MAG: hypothetical protein RL422_1364 [Bacteroidota bacterium]|jgi:hypothetical protein
MYLLKGNKNKRTGSIYFSYQNYNRIAALSNLKRKKSIFFEKNELPS